MRSAGCSVAVFTSQVLLSVAHHEGSPRMICSLLFAFKKKKCDICPKLRKKKAKTQNKTKQKMNYHLLLPEEKGKMKVDQMFSRYHLLGACSTGVGEWGFGRPTSFCWKPDVLGCAVGGYRQPWKGSPACLFLGEREDPRLYSPVKSCLSH